MKKIGHIFFQLIFPLLTIFSACGVKQETTQEKTPQLAPEKKQMPPIVTELGKKIAFPDTHYISHFKYEKAKIELLKDELTANTHVVASVVRNLDNKSYNLIIFNDSKLTANFSQYLVRLQNIKTDKLNYERIKDLYDNGAATGREVIEAQTLLQNEEAAIIENESQFFLAGLDPEDFQSHHIGTTWLICEIPENEIDKFIPGKKCKLRFKSFENKVFTGTIESIGDVVDNETRMIKLRIEMTDNYNGKIKAGMIGIAEFGTFEGKHLCVAENALVSVNNKDYVYVRTDIHTFEQREVVKGKTINYKTIIYSGLQEGEQVVTSGRNQLRDLSLEY
jgi:hypothetical protein